MHNLSAVRNVKLYAWQGRNGFTFYDSLGSFSIFCMRREKVQQKARLKRFYANAQKALVSGHRKYIFSEESISIKSEIAEGVNLWTAYKDWGFYENYIYIRNLSNQVILVRQSELSAEDHAWLVDLLTRHLGAALA